MNVTLKIYRFDPEKDKAHRYQEFTLDAQPTWRILDCLNQIRWKHDGTLAFRRACMHGVCGSDAVKINGVNRLACQSLVRDFKPGKKITVEPLPSLPVIKDLVVNMDDFFAKYEVVKPYLVTKSPPPDKERLQSPKDRKLLDGSYECILCACCTTSCPSYWADKKFLGPAALLWAYRYVFDSRDEATDERLDFVDGQEEVWRCHTIFNCHEACPKELNPTWAIGRLKTKIISRRF